MSASRGRRYGMRSVVNHSQENDKLTYPHCRARCLAISYLSTFLRSTELQNDTPVPEHSSYRPQTQTSIEHAQADLYQHRQEQQRQQHSQRPFNNDQWHTGSTYENGHAGHSSLFQHAFQVSNSTQAIHNKQKFTMGPRADCAKCLAGSSGHAGHWL